MKPTQGLKSQVSIELLFFFLAVLTGFIVFVYLANQTAEKILWDFDFFEKYSKNSIKGDGVLINPEKGYVKEKFGRPVNHLLNKEPEKVNGTFCLQRAGWLNERIIFFSVCS